MTTFDDIVTMTAPCPALEGFEGALRGSILNSWLGRQRADSVKLTVDGTEARFNVGASRVSLPVMDKADFQYQIPDVDKGVTIPGDSGFTACVVEAARSLGLDPSHQWRLGVTAIFSKDGIDIYSSDNVTCVHTSCSFDVPAELEGRSVVLPPRLVELVKADKAAPLQWILMDNVIALDYSGDRSIYCRSLGAGVPANHEGPFDAFDWESGFCDLPPDLDGILNGVQLIYSDKADARCTISFNGRAMVLTAKSTMGEVHEELEVTGAQQKGTLVVSPSMLQRCLDGMRDIKFTAGGIQLKSATADVLCSVDDGE